MSLPAIHSVS